MNYKKIYDSIIQRGLSRIPTGYTESHHIIPRCIGGTDDPNNLVKLTPEEHYVAHQLLVKIYNGNQKLVRAAIMMIPSRPSNKLYGWLKRRYSDNQKIAQAGKNNSQFGTMWINKDGMPKKIKKDELPLFLNSGWVIGRTVKVVKSDKVLSLKQKKVKNVDIKKVLGIKHKRIRNSESYRRAKANKMYKLYVVSRKSLREFAKIHDMVPMTLSKLFCQFIAEYKEREHYNKGKNGKGKLMASAPSL